MKEKMYNSNKELYKAINNNTHSYSAANVTKEYVLTNINNITHINSIEVTNVSKLDNSTLEFIYKNDTKYNYASIILNDISFNND